jgi:PEP-CTERM motif
METMRKNLVSKVLRASAFATACLALAGSNANAVNMTQTVTPTPIANTPALAGVAHTYSTGGTVDNSGITGTNVISFTPVVSGAFTTPSSLSLGEFQVATLPTGSQTDYNNTPFSITYNPVTIAGQNYTGGPITITGTLSGNVTGSQSSVVATFNSITSPVFTSADGTYLNTLSVLNSPLALVPSSAGGITTVQAGLVTTFPSPAGGGGTNPPATPEPTTLAILGTALVGLGLRKQLCKARLAD